MTPMETIERLAEHVGFDIGRTEFTFAADESGGFYSRTYEMDRALRRVPDVNECDPTGRLALVYLKRQFERDLRSQKVSLFDVVSFPGTVAGDAEMWRELCSPEVSAIEDGLAALMSRVTEEATGRRLLGDAQTAKKTVADSVERVVDGMRKCNLHVWLADGSPMRRPTTLPAAMTVFGSIAEAVVRASRMSDGMCLAYVRQERSTDGFFAVFMKSGGNLVSYDDMIPEAYPGQHGRFRNGRYLEAKSFDFFPYDEMVSFSGSDYKGYATGASVADGALPLSALPDDRCAALVLAMSCFAERVSGLVPDVGKRMYVTSLSDASADGIADALALRPDDAMVLANDIAPLTSITAAEALSADGWEPARRYGDHAAKEAALAILDGTFELDAPPIAGAGGPEWAGTADDMRSAAMLSARTQVASALMDNLHREFETWGGMERLRSWWHESLMSRREEIADMCARDWARRKEKGNLPDARDLPSFFAWWFDREGEPGKRNLRLGRPDGWLHGHGRVATLNATGRDSKGNWCMLDGDGRRCTVAYLFAAWDFADVTAMSGDDDVPLVVRLYTREASDGMFGYAGNDILDVCDPVGFLHNPLRGYTWAGYHEQERDDGNAFDFTFQIGFTKRELNALAKRIADAEEAR